MSTAPKILLAEWAKRRYDPPPSDWVLRKWVRRGEIVPMPELVGKAYYVEPTARRLVADGTNSDQPTQPAAGGLTLVQRLQAGA